MGNYLLLVETKILEVCQFCVQMEISLHLTSIRSNIYIS